MKLNVFELLKQLEKYRSALDKCLAEKFPDEPQAIEIIVLHGEPIGGADKEKIDRLLWTLNARAICYDTLLAESINCYQEYLDANERISKIASIIDRI